MKWSKNYPLQVEDGGHLCKSSKLVPDGPGGYSGKIRHKRPKLFIELQPSELWQKKDQKQWDACIKYKNPFRVFP